MSLQNYFVRFWGSNLLDWGNKAKTSARYGFYKLCFAIKLGEGWYPASSNPANRLDTAPRVAAAIEGFTTMASKAGRDPKSIALAHVVLWPVNWEAETAISGGRRTLTGTSSEMLADVDVLQRSGIGDVCVSFHAASAAEMVKRMQRFAAEVLAKSHA